MNEESELLARYALDGVQSSFTEVVRARAGFVYAAALRRTNGNVHLASDVTQQVFVALARNARQLSRHPALSGWLYLTTRNIAAQIIRTENRRQKREKESVMIHETTVFTSPESDAGKFRDHLDAALDELNERDRQAVLLRFFEGRSFAEIAAASRLNENAARMRVERALEKLRAAFNRKGVASTAAAIGAGLTAQASVTPPAALTATLAQTAMAGAGIGAGTWTLTFMSMTKLQTCLALTAITLGLGGVIFHAHTTATLQKKIDQLTRENQTVIALQRENSKLKQSAVSTSQPQQNQNVQNGAPESAIASGIPKPSPKRGSAALGNGLIPVDNLGHADRLSARNAFSTQIWAAAQGDVDLEQSSIFLRPDVRAKLEALLATLPAASRESYGTPEHLMAAVLAGSLHPVGGMQILSEKTLSADSVILETQWQHVDDTIVHHSNVELRRDDTGNWQMVVPMVLADRAVAYLRGNLGAQKN